MRAVALWLMTLSRRTNMNDNVPRGVLNALGIELIFVAIVYVAYVMIGLLVRVAS